MKRNRLRQGLRSNRKLKDSFYYFLVDNKIDWAIILGCILCILPYLASHYWYFILMKSTLLITIIYVSLRYLRIWNSLRDIDVNKKDAIVKLKGFIDKEKINELTEFQIQFSEKLNALTTDFQKKKDEYEDFKEYLLQNKEVASDLEEFLNRDLNLTKSAFGAFLGIFLVLVDLQNLPRLRLFNYYKLLAILFLTVSFFIIYAIENSI